MPTATGARGQGLGLGRGLTEPPDEPGPARRAGAAQRVLAVAVIVSVALPLPAALGGGITVFPFTVALVPVLAIWFVQACVGQSRRVTDRRGLDPVVVAMLCFAAAAWWSAYATGSSMRHACLWFSLTGLFAFARYRLPVLLAPSAVRRTVVAVVLVVGLVCLVQFATGSSLGALYRYFPDPNEKLGQVHTGGTGILKRVQGPFYGSNINGQFMTYALVWLVATVHVERRRTTAGTVAVAVAAVAIVLTFSRGNWVIAPMAVLVVTMALARFRVVSYDRLVRVVFAAVCAALVLAVSVPESWLSRFDPSQVSESSANRLVPFDVALEVIQREPLFGVGYANFVEGAAGFGLEAQDRPHNTYVQVFAEQGIVAEVAFFSMVALLLAEPYRLRRRGRRAPPGSRAAVACIAITLAWLAYMLVYATANDYAVTPIIVLLCGYSLASAADARCAGRGHPDQGGQRLGLGRGDR